MTSYRGFRLSTYEYQRRKAYARRDLGHSWPCANYEHARCHGQLSTTGGAPASTDPACACTCHD